LLLSSGKKRENDRKPTWWVPWLSWPQASLFPFLPENGSRIQLLKHSSFTILKFRQWTKSKRTILHYTAHHQETSDFN
jgi:hypothetical protein